MKIKAEYKADIIDLIKRDDIKRALDENDFDYIYSFSSRNPKPGALPRNQALTKVFLNADIDPLLHLRELPTGYFYKGTRSIIDLRESSIQGTDINCIADMNYLEKIYFSKSLQLIRPMSVVNCPRLKEIYLPKSLVDIHTNAFVNTAIEVIYYEGSEEDWKYLMGSLPLSAYGWISPRTGIYFNVKY